MVFLSTAAHPIIRSTIRLVVISCIVLTVFLQAPTLITHATVCADTQSRSQLPAHTNYIEANNPNASQDSADNPNANQTVNAENKSVTTPLALTQSGTLSDNAGRIFKIGVSEVRRGEAAFKRVLRAASMFAKPAAGKEYLLLFVVVRYVSGPQLQNEDDLNFNLYVSCGLLKPIMSIPSLNPVFHVEYDSQVIGGGWMLYEIPSDEANPLLMAELDDLQNNQQGVPLYFSTTETAH